MWAMPNPPIVRGYFLKLQPLLNKGWSNVDILPGLKALGKNRAVAPMRVDISQAAATVAVVWLLTDRSV